MIDGVIVTNIFFDDYPDFCDAYIEYAEKDGVPMTDEELEELNEDRDFVYECTLNQIH